MMIPLHQWKEELEHELNRILEYWMRLTPDEQHGGFVGKIASDNTIDPSAPKGSVLNSRILYTFAAAYNYQQNAAYLQVATRAWKYIEAHFIDPAFGGVYWSVDHLGQPLDTKKQVYAIAFAIYAIAEYYKATQDAAVLQTALGLCKALEQHAYDSKHHGYIEALGREWNDIADLRLSSKDANEKKSMNTHLHVLEAYTNLYSVWPNAALKQQLSSVLQLFLEHIIHPVSHHLILFFDEAWNSKSEMISYGHDIEAAWLLVEAAAVVGDEQLIAAVEERSIAIAHAAAKGLDADGGLWYEKDGQTLVKEKHWWPQAEAIVGFYHAWQHSSNNTFLEASYNAWRYAKANIIDYKNGEWFWGRTANGEVMKEDKVGIWKCPYHNGRACIEMLRRLTETTLAQTQTIAHL